MKKPITTIIFDWAGVFCTAGEPFSHPDLSKETGLSVDEMGCKTQGIQKPYYLGQIKPAEFWKNVIDFFKLKNITDKELSEAYLDSYKIYPEMLELAKILKKNYKTAVLSNSTEEMMAHIVETHGLKNCFTEMFFSNQMGLMKPENKAYEFALKKLGALPEETIFTDDSATNVEAAKKMGINAFVFESPAQCKKELENFGVKI